MDSKKFKIFTISMILILILAGTIFLTGLIISSSKGSISSRNSFNIITQKITKSADDYGILTENFLTQSEEILKNEKYLNAITIQKDDIVFYAYPLTSKLLKADEKGNAFITSTSPLNKIYTKNVLLLNGDSLNFTVAYNTILPEQIFNLGKITFFIILICVVLTIIAIPYIKMKEKENNSNIKINEKNDKAEQNSNINYEEDFEEDLIDVNDVPEIDFDSNEEVELPQALNQIDIGENSENQIIIQNEQDFDSEILEEVKIENKDLVENEYVSQEELKEDNIPPKFTVKNDPMGLFSGVSGFGWESYFEPRLDSELVRATSSEQDVSLFMITLPGLNKRSQAAEEIYQVILDFFKYRDMIFEYKNDSFAGIHINMNLESAINYAEQLFINLYAIYEEHNLTSKIGIGISTRSMRLVPGNRLISEAEQAAEKAMEEETMPIVAFKVNHEKYTEYVSEEA